MNTLHVREKHPKIYRAFIIGIFLLFLGHRYVKGCLWKENIIPDIKGSISPILNITQDECCQYCLDNFIDTLAAFYITENSKCTCLKEYHKTVESNGSYYTYIARDPITLDQSNYTCGSRGKISILIFYFVVSEYEIYYVQFVNMDIKLNLTTSVLMMDGSQIQNKKIIFDNVHVGYSNIAINFASVNFYRRLTISFWTGFVNKTSHFAISHTRVANSPLRLIVYLKPLIVVPTVMNSQAAPWVYPSYLYQAIKQNAIKSLTSIRNDDVSSTADSENVTLTIYFNEKLITYKEVSFSVSGSVANVTAQCFVQKNQVKFVVPLLRIGVYLDISVLFYSLMKDQQQSGSLFHEILAITYQNGNPQQPYRKFIISYSDVEVQKRARNRQFVGDILSLTQFDNVLLVCEMAIDRTKHYCGILSFENTPTFTKLSAVFVEPICFHNKTRNIYFKDKFGNVVVYNYLNKNTIRLPVTKEKILQQSSIILPFTTSKDQKLFCCDANAQVGTYNGSPFYSSVNVFIIRNWRMFYWAAPSIYIPSYF